MFRGGSLNTQIGIKEELDGEFQSMKEATIPKSSECVSEILDDDKKRKLPTLIVEKVQENALLFTDGKERTYAQFEVAGHKETWTINSRRFKSWLYKLGKELNNDDIPNPENINTVVKYLEALAFEEPEIKLYNRVAKSDGEFLYDLTNENWQVIRINSQQWVVEDNFPPIFTRHAHQKEQVYPVKGGDVWVLFKFLKVPEGKKLLLLIYIISCFVPDISHPVDLMSGPPGSGKSMTMEFTGDIINPSHTPRLKMPKGDKEIVQVFDHHYATHFDNLDVLPNWFSDIVCRAVTGEGSEYRSLYSDDGAVIREYRRCVGLNGVNVAATQVDLLDRSILVELEKFPEGVRMEEEKLRRNFANEKPRILGGIFDTLVKAMKVYPSVEIYNLPRMADFAMWGYAIGEALGGYGEEFLKLYSDNENERVHETIFQNNLANAVVALINKHKTWTGTAADLLEDLKIVAENDKIPIDSGSWPKAPAWLARKLNEIQPVLEHLGISLDKSRDGGKRYLTLHVEENADHGVMVSSKVQEPPKDEISNKNMTTNMTMNDSKIKKHSVISKLDSNDKRDSKKGMLKSS